MRSRRFSGGAEPFASFVPVFDDLLSNSCE